MNKKDNCDPYQFPATHKSNDISQTFKKVNSLFFFCSQYLGFDEYLSIQPNHLHCASLRFIIVF